VCSQTLFAQQSVFDIARNGSVEDLKALMKSNPDVINSKNDRGHTPLILASYKGNTDVALFLINNVKDINAMSPDGTALMAAAVFGNAHVIDALIAKKADLEVADSNGNTALLLSMIFRKTDIVEQLYYAGANVHAKDKKGNTALDYAKKMKLEKLISLLKKKNL